MSHFQFWLIFLAVVVVDGRPRHQHKRKPVFTAPGKKTQYYQQAIADQPLLDAPGDPQNLNVYNVHVQKSHKDNKVSGHMGPHSVSVSMEGPGTVSLDTSQLNVQPDDQQPDNTITMVKDSGPCPQCSMVKVKTGLKGPIPLPLTGASTPAEPSSKAAKPGHDGVSPALDEDKQKHPERRRKKEDLLEKEQDLVKQEHKPEQLRHEPEEENKPVEKPENEIPMVHVHHQVDKTLANKIITNLESSIPVMARKPKHEEQVVNGHKLKIESGENHQKVVGKMDPNNVNIVAQGPKTVAVTSSGTELSQSVVFDPNPYCPDKPCPPGQGSEEGQGHN